MDNPLFKRGDLVYANDDTYGITSRSNAYIGLVLNDVYSLEDDLHVLNFYCSRDDTSYHLSLLSDEALARAITMVRSNTHVYDKTILERFNDSKFSLNILFPGIPAEEQVSTVWGYTVTAFHFTLLIPEIIPLYLDSSMRTYGSTQNHDFITHKLATCFIPFSPVPSSSIIL